jgi:hypothetical protein
MDKVKPFFNTQSIFYLVVRGSLFSGEMLGENDIPERINLTFLLAT